MVPPKIIRVLGKRYLMEPVSDPEVAVVRGGSYGCMGATDFDAGRIKYRAAGPDASPDEEADTVVHELLHVILNSVSLDRHFKGHESAEVVVAAASPILLDALRRNPELVAYLMEESPVGEEEKASAKAKGS